jgi:hypothetical protein
MTVLNKRIAAAAPQPISVQPLAAASPSTLPLISAMIAAAPSAIPRDEAHRLGQQMLSSAEQQQSSRHGGQHPSPPVGSEDAEEDLALVRHFAVGKLGEFGEHVLLVDEVQPGRQQDRAQDQRRAAREADPLLGACGATVVRHFQPSWPCDECVSVVDYRLG